MTPKSKLLIKNVNCNPTRIGFINILKKKMNAKIKIKNLRKKTGEEPVGDIMVESSALKPIQCPKKIVPSLIDEFPILAILATQAKGKTEVRGAKELRIKECDRIHAVSKNLIRMGANIKELEDGFIINCQTQLKCA